MVVVVVEIAVASVVGVYYLKSITLNPDNIYFLTKCPPEPPKKLLKAFVSPEKKPPLF